MDIDRIFKLFNEDEPQTLPSFKDHPLYYIIMFKKTISNYLRTRDFYIKTIKQSHPDLEWEDIKKAGDYLFFNKAYGYLQTIEDLKMDTKDLHTTNMDVFNEALTYFESTEEYEKCILIKKFMNNLVNIIC